jgi:hypothetical protein
MRPIDHPVFSDAVLDLASLGVHVEPCPSAGARRYAIISGRSNARWWLIPLASSGATASGLALFQPLLLSARLLKAAAIALSHVGLARLWARTHVFVTGEPGIGHCFGTTERLAFSYFTGTDSPHRKVAVQIMNGCGELKGFAKVTRDANVASLLAHEAAMLGRVQLLNLASAYVPRVLHFGEMSGATVLVTDTRKSRSTRGTVRFSHHHRAFLLELARLTAQSPVPATHFAGVFWDRLHHVHGRLDRAWRDRLSSSIRALEAHPTLEVPVSLSHGDFTPSNTFLSGSRLYVFDWEYAVEGLPSSNDIIHFALAQPSVKRLSVPEQGARIKERLTEPWTGFRAHEVAALLFMYLIHHSLWHIERAASLDLVPEWDGVRSVAGLLDWLLVDADRIATPASTDA